MGQVTVEIGGRSYRVACRDGDEPHLTALAGYLRQRADELTASLGSMNESRLLLLTGLMVADELFEARQRSAAPAADAAAAPPPAADASALDAIAERLEAIAEALERNDPAT